MNEAFDYPDDTPRGIDQLRLSEEVGLGQIAFVITDTDTFDMVAKAVHTGYERKWQNMQPIQPKKHRGSPFPSHN